MTPTALAETSPDEIGLGSCRDPRSEGIAIILEFFLNFCLGLVFALCARERIRAEGSFPMPAFVLVAMYVVAIRLPMATYLYWAHSSWSWLYLVDPADMPELIVVLAVLLQSGAVIGGWYLGAYLLQNGQSRIIAYATAGSGGLFVLLFAIFAGRLGRYGSYQEFADHATLGLFDVKLGYVLIALILGIGAGVGFVAMELVRNARRVRTR